MRTLHVESKTVEADGVVSFVLAGDALPEWAPGAHVDVEIRSGLLRQYSLCGDPGDRGRWRIAVLREDPGRGGSAHLHDRVEVGDTVRAGEPRNNFPLVPAARYRFVAGGIGITPLLPMLRHADRAGVDWELYYGGRHRSRMAFLDELAVHGPRVRILPEDEHGLLPLTEIVATGAQVYCCGPGPLLDAVERLCPPERLHLERFQPRAVAETPAREFEVVASASGRTVRVAPGQSVLDALDRAGLTMPSSCREGTCGSCETTVLDGEVEHRDSVLTDQEREAGKTMMVCVSRARRDRLVLDV